MNLKVSLVLLAALVALVMFVESTQAHYDSDNSRNLYKDPRRSGRFEEPEEINEADDIEGPDEEPTARRDSPCMQKWIKGEKCDPSEYEYQCG